MEIMHKKRALILTWEGFQDHELIYPFYSLKEHGFDVDIVANKKGRIYGILGCHMTCTIDINEFKENYSTLLQYDILVVPGGVKALEKLRQEERVLQFVKDWDNGNKTILSLCNGAQLLISADILDGRELSGYYSINIDITNAGAEYHPGPVCVDGNIISSPHYDNMGEWMKVGLETHNNRYTPETII
jgi:protease I